jgi:hypothetical protein
VDPVDPDPQHCLTILIFRYYLPLNRLSNPACVPSDRPACPKRRPHRPSASPGSPCSPQWSRTAGTTWTTGRRSPRPSSPPPGRGDSSPDAKFYRCLKGLLRIQIIEKEIGTDLAFSSEPNSDIHSYIQRFRIWSEASCECGCVST